MKKIQYMSDNGVSIESRRKAFEKWMSDYDLQENEATKLLGKEFLQ